MIPQGLTSNKKSSHNTRKSGTKVRFSEAKPRRKSAARVSAPHDSSYNAVKLPFLKFVMVNEPRGVTHRDVAKAFDYEEASVRTRMRKYLKWDWLWRTIPPRRPGTKRPRGRGKFVYHITEKGRHEVGLLEALQARGLPLKPRKYKLPKDGALGNG